VVAANGSTVPVSANSDRRSGNSVLLNIGLLNNFQRIIDLDPKVADGALQIRMSQQQLDGPEIPSPAIYQNGFGAPERVCTLFRWVQTDFSYPASDNPCILACRQMLRRLKPALEKSVLWHQPVPNYPVSEWVPSLLGDLKLHGPMGFLLHYDASIGNSGTLGDITRPDLDQVASPELAVESQVEQGQIAMPMG
jgi:hypothetical protein